MTSTLTAPPQQTGALAAFQDTMKSLDAIAVSAGMDLSTGNGFSQAIIMASGIVQLRDALTPEIMQRVFLPLMNSRLGFRTDKDPNRPVWNKRKSCMEAPDPYGMEIVREAIIESTLRGLPPVGNCFNIIAQSAYVTKEGFWFLLSKRVPGLTDFKVHVGVPKMIAAAGDARNASDEEAKGAVVNCFATWKLHGKEDRTERDIPIRVNAMMGADAIMGKAERKILAAAYAQITGTTLSEADADDTEASPMRTVNPAAVPRSKPAPTGAGFQTVEEPEEKPAADSRPQPDRRQSRTADGVAGVGADRLTADGSVIAYYDDGEVRKSKPGAPNPWVQYKIRVSVAAKVETFFINDDAQMGEWIASLEEGTRLRLWLTGTVIARAELAPEGGEA